MRLRRPGATIEGLVQRQSLVRVRAMTLTMEWCRENGAPSTSSGCISPRPMSSKSELLQDRLAKFAADVDALIDRFPRDIGGQNLARQLSKSSTSPFANYCEACEAESTADYVHKMKIGLKELRETRAWLVYAGTRSHGTLLIEPLKKECNELIAIFVVCIRKAKGEG